MHQTHRKEFLRAYREICGRERMRGNKADVDSLISLTLESTRPPDFGVSYDTAVVMIGRLRRDRPDFSGETRPRRLFWLDMLQRVDRQMEAPRNLRLCRAVQNVLTYQRPSRWYMSPAAAKRIII